MASRSFAGWWGMSKWLMARLGDVFSLIRNGASIKQGEIEGGYPITRIETISDQYVDRKRMGYAGINDITKFREYILEDNDILMSHINSPKHLGKAALFKRKEKEIIIHGMNLLILRTRADMMDAAYALLYFKTFNFKKQLSKITKDSVNQSSFSITGLKEIIIPLPPLDEQKRIATMLDKAQSLIDLRKKQIAEMDALVRAKFIDIFGDPVKNEKGWASSKLKEIAKLIQSGNTPKGGKQVYVDSGILFFRSQNVWKNRIDLTDIAFIDEKTHKKMIKTRLKNKDILITKTGRFNTENSSLGRAALFLGEDDTANINGHVYLVRLKEGIVHEFVLYILITDEYRDYIRNVCVGGIDKRQINKEHLEEFPILIPPLELQNLFADFVRRVDKTKLAKQKSLEQMESLYNALMQRAFG